MLRTALGLAIGAALAGCGPVDTNGSGPATTAADAGTPATGAPATGAPATGNGGGNAGAPAAPGKGSPAPSLSIVSPRNGDECEVGEEDHEHDHSRCGVEISLSGAVLAPPGRCGGSSGTCGHIDFFIDGTSCGSPNTQASTTSFDPKLDKCPSIEGQHTFSSELRDDHGARLASSQNVTVFVKRHE